MSQPGFDKESTPEQPGDEAMVEEVVVVEEVDDMPEDVADDVWVEDTSGPSLLSRMAAEVGGTFILVFMGVGTALFLSVGNNGTLTAAFGFALGVIIAATIFGGVSGAHLNPAVTVGVWLSGRFPGRDVAPYVLAQLVGASFAGALLFGVSSGHPSIESGREFVATGANGYGDHSPAGFGLVSGLVIEIVIAALLVSVVLSATSVRANPAVAPFAIGLTVGFLVLVAIPFTNGALNPARSTGIALFSDTWALQQVWLFWLAPMLGAAVAGLMFRAFGPEEDLETVEVLESIED
ncbi:aquaporin [Demequina mangrovi]|uniref:Aquaporin Z n=1 Tax=Demequina mangrovi TaxID=1043493 RepID=A0A1H6WTE3_9MICO|nr:aquaporin [Demequina mangrovi]SEJ18514.1 aquaporin Z [Demequina mangrovi]